MQTAVSLMPTGGAASRLDAAYRELAWQHLTTQAFDVVVIGGGVTGPGRPWTPPPAGCPRR